MSDVKHTPGPWQVLAGEPGDRSSRTIVALTPYRKIASVRVDGAVQPLPCEEADARLIAAAPDLLAALEECRLWLGSDEPMPTAKMWELGAIVRAAITKAKGRADAEEPTTVQEARAAIAKAEGRAP